MSTIAILTIKRFDAAKQRLGDAGIRPALAEAMMTDVLDAIAGSDAVDEVLIVSGEPRTHSHGRVIEDPDEGHNPAATRGIDAAIERGATRVVLLAGDCPLLDPVDLDSLLIDRGDHLVVIADRHGTGTNGLIISPPRAVAPSFGEGSCARHQELAAAAGIECTVATGTSLALDIDTPDDLRALIESTETQRAPNTRAVLSAEGLL